MGKNALKILTVVDNYLLCENNLNPLLGANAKQGFAEWKNPEDFFITLGKFHFPMKCGVSREKCKAFFLAKKIAM